MVIIHIANIDTDVIGGVQVAVPKMVRAQSKYADIGLINTSGKAVDGVRELHFGEKPDIAALPEPFNKPDIIIFHEVYRFEYIGIYRAAAAANIPYIIIPHGCLSKTAQHKKFLKKLAANILYFNRFISSARAIQYLSENEKNMSFFSKCTFFVSGNGVAIPHKRKTAFSDCGIKFVYIGRLEVHIKGLDLMLKAMKKCERFLRQKNAVLMIYGPDYSGSHYQISRMTEKLGISDLVLLGREKLGTEKEEILLSSDCFIQTSRTEGLPLGPLEALAYGIPCIVTEGVGLGDIIERFGVGIKCKTDVDSIADGIKRFITEFDNVKSMSDSAVKLIKEQFDTDMIAEKTVEEYRSMAKKQQARK